MNKLKTVFGKVFSILLTVVVLLSLCAVAFTTFFKTDKKISFIGKYAIVRILTESMKPEIQPNDYILVEKVDPSDLKKDDVITFVSSDPAIKGQLNTHRIVSINGTVITTKGDNNPNEDSYTVDFADVQGRYVARLGFVSSLSNVFSNPIGYVVLIALPMMLILSSYMRDLVQSVKSAKKEEVEVSEEDRIARAIEEMKSSGELDKRLSEINSPNGNKEG